jgi:hypothetical protein
VTEKKTLILAQMLIALMMAALMTGIFGFLHLGPTTQWLTEWGKSFLMAFPLAFLLSLGVGPLAFRLARLITRR